MSDPDLSRSMRGFLFLWSLAAIFEFFYAQPTDPLRLVLAGLAVCLALAPGSLVILVPLVAVQLAAALVAVPHNWNHELWVIAVDVLLLIALGNAIRSEARPLTVERLAPHFVPAARVSVAIVYALCALQKANYDFLFAPDLSCGAVRYQELVDAFPRLHLPGGPWALWASMWSTFATEALLPVFLIVPSLRSIGLVWGAVFHFSIGIVANTDFSTYAFAMLALFMSEEHWETAARWLRSGLGRFAQSWPLRIAALTAIIVWLSPVSRPFGSLQLRWILLGMSHIALQAVGLTGWAAAYRHADFGIRIRSRLQYFPLLLLIAFALSPYLGFRTEGAFSMYSNLRTEGGVSNHLFLRDVGLFSYQKQLVEMVSPARPDKMVEFEFERFVRHEFANGRDYSVTFRRGTELVGPVSIRTLVGNLPAEHYWETKLLWFRSVPGDDRNVCQH